MQTTRNERPILHATDAEGSVQLIGREIGQPVMRHGLHRQPGMGVEKTRQQRQDQRIGDARGHPEAQVAARRFPLPHRGAGGFGFAGDGAAARGQFLAGVSTTPRPRRRNSVTPSILSSTARWWLMAEGTTPSRRAAPVRPPAAATSARTTSRCGRSGVIIQSD